MAAHHWQTWPWSLSSWLDTWEELDPIVFGPQLALPVCDVCGGRLRWAGDTWFHVVILTNDHHDPVPADGERVYVVRRVTALRDEQRNLRARMRRAQRRIPGS